MKRIAFFVYGILCYLLFLGVYVYFAGFVGNFLVPKSIDSGTAAVPLALAVLVDLGLIALFAVQHTVMARPAFKQVWTRLIPQPIGRSTYVLLSCAVLILLMGLWQPIPIVLWNVRNAAGAGLLTGIYIAGWFAVPLVTLLIHHFDLFGTRQVWLHLRGQPYTSLPFKTPLVYRYVRHPLYVAWAIFFFATPTMTLGHLLFAGVLTVYMIAASKVEERDLVAHFGKAYEDYRRRVPAFVPFTRPLAAEPTLAAPASSPENA